MERLIYPAIFEKLTESPDGYCVEFPDLPGCVTQGRTLQEAFAVAEDAAAGWILTSIEDGETIPAPSDMSDVSVSEPGAFVNLVQLDMDEYARQHSNKAVKKTLTIPQWLNTAAEQERVNFSQVLQEALKERLGLA